MEMDILTNNFYLLLYLKATTSYQWCTAGKILKWFFLIFAGMSKVQKDISSRILFCAVFFFGSGWKKNYLYGSGLLGLECSITYDAASVQNISH